MPRGARKDKAATKCLRANGLFLDGHSFIGMPDINGGVHLYLKGDDVKMQRERVWAKSKRKCGLCKTEIVYPEGDFETGWEMDHIKGGLSERCDCLHNLQAVHHKCHREKHVQTRFTPGLNKMREEAKRDFERLYGQEKTDA